MEKQLRRSKQGSVLGGVAGGLAKHFNIDVVIVRLLFVISLFVSFGVSLFAYIVLWVVLPEEPLFRFGNTSNLEERPITTVEPSNGSGGSNSDRNLKIIAIGLIGFGTYMLLDQYIAWYHLGKFFWPLALIGVGAFLLLRKRDQDYESGFQSPPPPPAQPPAGPATDNSGRWPSSEQSDTSSNDINKPGKDDSEESFKVN